ncbi:piRNA biogenesis protein EXD1-like [Lineus longissimus]|uniref:piRNA biogenesis protein EXD1-like n=1 Tax=Lineus longissimus TaxID=88925 RepID=UPI00315C5409
MASSASSEPPFQLVDQHDQVEHAIAAINREELIAVDCEGVNLGRDGSLTVVAIGTRTDTFLFDVLKLGARVFDRGLREILEDVNTVKLMFDCRGDSDALWHHNKVRLANVMDIQLMQVLYERRHPDEKPQAQKDTEKRFEEKGKKFKKQKALNEWPRVRGLAQCIAWYLNDASILATKTSCSLPHADGSTDHEMWGKRPITRDMQLYAAIDVYVLFPLYDKFKRGITYENMKKAKRGSDRYAGFFRDRKVIAPNPYECHNLLHMYILDDQPASRRKKKCPVCGFSLPSADINRDTGLCKLCRLKKFKIESAKIGKEKWEEHERKRLEKEQEELEEQEQD